MKNVPPPSGFPTLLLFRPGDEDHPIPFNLGQRAFEFLKSFVDAHTATSVPVGETPPTDDGSGKGGEL